MKVTHVAGDGTIASVYVATWGADRQVEMVASLQPPLPRKEKWVLIVSTLFGCPGRCRMCDAGEAYYGKLSAQQILDQIDWLVDRHYPDHVIPAGKFKIQFARMGDPALNPAVLDVLEYLPARYDAPGLLPSISTIAPRGTDRFFERLTDVKQRHYRNGRFQMQFSLHSTDELTRDSLMPLPKWRLEQIAAFGEKFHSPGDRKIALNFAVTENSPVDPAVLAATFDPKSFCIKLTPLNPTFAAARHGLHSVSATLEDRHTLKLVDSLRTKGFDVIVSVGELAENQIGSNCGQYVSCLEAADRWPSSAGHIVALRRK